MIEIEKIIRDLIASVVGGLNLPPIDFTLEHPDELARGDYATNVALVLAKVTGQKPLALAQQIAEKLKASPLEIPKARPWAGVSPWLERMEVVAPGFINFFLTRDFFTHELSQILKSGGKYGWDIGKEGEKKKVLVEYTDPNPFKEFHLGHLMSNTIGEAISRLVESQGAEGKRVCYQGDVGMHVAKAIWGNLKLNLPAGGKNAKETKEIKEWGQAYALGAQAYESDETAKREISEINKKVYVRNDPEINALYDAGRELSLDYFETIYKRLGTKFDYYFFESESGPVGQKLVEEHLDAGLPLGSPASSAAVFERSDGAVIFRGEKYGLHTRVFLNTEGLPTYEAKELGLAKLKFDKYPGNEFVVITGNEVTGYFAVVKKALELILPDLAKKTRHLPHGMLRLPTGKMSSRTGTVITAESLLAEIKMAVKQKMSERNFSLEEHELVAEAVTIAAVKYSILKQSPGRDIIFDLTKSLSLEGDSGPYLQYAYVRARAVLVKAATENISVNTKNVGESLPEISELERRLTRFPEVVSRATALYAPNLLVTYLTELASAFNAYYASQKIIDPADPQSPYRLALTTAFSRIMKSGLNLLAISVLERM